MCLLPIKELLIASHNQGKLREFAALVEPFAIKLRSAAELALAEPPETGTTFEENAFIKAHAAAVATGLVALSDDSGLCVDALAGRPGIYTADWAIQKDGSRDFAVAMARLESELQAQGVVQPDERCAHFVCVLCLAWPDGKAYYFRGEVAGHIHYPPTGDGGFGYDPIFMPAGFDRTFAEMKREEKNGLDKDGEPLSHRARALKLFMQAMLKR